MFFALLSQWFLHGNVCESACFICFILVVLQVACVLAVLIYPNDIAIDTSGYLLFYRLIRPLASRLRSQRKRCSKRLSVLSCYLNYLESIYCSDNLRCNTNLSVRISIAMFFCADSHMIIIMKYTGYTSCYRCVSCRAKGESTYHTHTSLAASWRDRRAI